MAGHNKSFAVLSKTDLPLYRILERLSKDSNMTLRDVYMYFQDSYDHDWKIKSKNFTSYPKYPELLHKFYILSLDNFLRRFFVEHVKSDTHRLFNEWWTLTKKEIGIE